MSFDFSSIDEYVNKYDGMKPGISLSVLKNNQLIYQKSIGYANLEYEIPITNETVFNLASVSKPITAIGIMILKEAGKLTYEDSITNFFPELNHYCKDVTIRHLLNHTSGIINYYRILDRYHLSDIGFTSDDCLRYLIKEQELLFKPGEQFDYSNSNYVLLGMLIERVTNGSLNSFLKEHVFHPLEMKSAVVYNEEQPVIKNRAFGYGIKDNKIYCDYIGALTTGDGSCFASMNDLIAFEKVLYTKNLISKESMKEALTTSTLNDGTLGEYGFGWETKRSPEEIYHSGLDHGARALFVTYPNRKITIIILANFNELLGSEMRLLVENILDIVE